MPNSRKDIFMKVTMIKSIVEFMTAPENVRMLAIAWCKCALIISPFVLFILAIVWKENRKDGND